MPRHSFVQISKLPDVRGRVDYISNPIRQEHLYATYSTAEPDFWKRLAEQAQFDFRKSNQKSGRCIEARELIIALPESLQKFNPQFLLKTFTERFHKTYDVQCTSALHHNKAMTNYHIHLIFADREPLDQPEVKYASRNMFYDENGRHVRTKKEILDVDRKIRPGCRIIPKGEAYEIRYFSERQDRFKEKSFLQEVKDMYTDLINECVMDEKDRLQVFDKSGPYLPTKKIGKNNPKAKEIQHDNELRKEWNRTVDQVLIAGGSEEEVTAFKKEYVTEKVAESIKRNGVQPGIFASILRSAVEVLKTFYRFLMFRLEKAEKEATADHIHVPAQESMIVSSFDPAELQHAKAEYMHMQSLHDDLTTINKKIYAIEKSIKNLNMQLKRLENGFADIILHMFERRELKMKIISQEEKLEEAREQLRLYPAQHGYASVDEIERKFFEAKGEYNSLLRQEEIYNAKARLPHYSTDRENSEIKKVVEPAGVAKTPLGKMVDTGKHSFGDKHVSVLESKPLEPGGSRKQRTSILTKLAQKQSVVEQKRQENHQARNAVKKYNDIEM